MRPPKRYVLLLSDTELRKADIETVEKALAGMYGGAKGIQVPENGKALIVKTNIEVAKAIRDRGEFSIGGSLLRPVLTSGAIGKLKWASPAPR